MPEQRWFISEFDVGSGSETRAGAENGYPTLKAANAAAERLVRQDFSKTYCIALYKVYNGERDYVQTCGYVDAESLIV